MPAKIESSVHIKGTPAQWMVVIYGWTYLVTKRRIPRLWSGCLCLYGQFRNFSAAEVGYELNTWLFHRWDVSTTNMLMVLQAKLSIYITSSISA